MWLFTGDSMEGPYFQPETFMRLTYSLVYDCINVWIIIKCGMASFIGLACMCCLHCTCMQLCVHICTLNAALNAECLLNVAWLHLLGWLACAVCTAHAHACSYVCIFLCWLQLWPLNAFLYLCRERAAFYTIQFLLQRK